jgi:Xaa-Pro aminopeptidase
MNYPASRRQRLTQQLEAHQLDAFVISSTVNVSYLTGFSGDASVLVVTPRQVILVSDFRYIEQIAEECPGLETYIRPTKQRLPEAVAQTLNGLGPRSVGFESNTVTVGEWQFLRDLTPTLDWKPVADLVEPMRACKDPSELAQIREAIRIAENAFIAFRAMVRPIDTEKDLCDALEAYIRRAGGKGSSFPPIVAVGERAALPHAPPTQRTVESGEMLLVDWGASGEFYKSDLTRTMAARKISTKLKELYMVVSNAHQQAIQAVRPGVTAEAVDAVARGIIGEAGFGNFFGHGLGHGIGLQIHEGPMLRPGSQVVLQPGMVITIEPGIYVPGWGGIRIEDDVLVTKEGCEVLTHLPRDLESLYG